MHSEMISVIVPVYNTNPNLLLKCLDSILRQTYKNIECVVVDDGSYNKQTLALLDSFSKRINILRKKNGGVSSARNLGIAQSKGEYIIFVDSDDFISDGYIEEMYNAMIMNDVSIVFSGKTNSYSGKNDSPIKNSLVDIRRDPDMFILNTASFTSQGVLIRKRILNNKHMFDEKLKRAGEDTLFMLELLMSDVSYYLGNGGYYYIQHSDSLTHSYKKISDIDTYVYDYYRLFDAIEDRFPDKYNVLAYRKIEVINRAARKIFEFDKNIGYAVFRKKIEQYKKDAHISQKIIQIKCNNHSFANVLTEFFINYSAYFLVFSKHKLAMIRNNYKRRNR